VSLEGQNANSDTAQTTFRSEGNYGCCILGQELGPQHSEEICQRVDRTGLATEHKAGCDRPKSVRSEANIAAVIFNAEKSVGCHVKKSITLSFFNRIIFHLAVRYRIFQKINL